MCNKALLYLKMEKKRRACVELEKRWRVIRSIE